MKTHTIIQSCHLPPTLWYIDLDDHDKWKTSLTNWNEKQAWPTETKTEMLKVLV